MITALHRNARIWTPPRKQEMELVRDGRRSTAVVSSARSLERVGSWPGWGFARGGPIGSTTPNGHGRYRHVPTPVRPVGHPYVNTARERELDSLLLLGGTPLEGALVSPDPPDDTGDAVGESDGGDVMAPGMGGAKGPGLERVGLTGAVSGQEGRRNETEGIRGASRSSWHLRSSAFAWSCWISRRAWVSATLRYAGSVSSSRTRWALHGNLEDGLCEIDGHVRIVHKDSSPVFGLRGR